MNNEKEILIDRWDEILEFLRTQYNITKVSFNTWLKSLKVKDVKDDLVVLYSSDPSIGSNLSFIKNKYGAFIKNAIEEMLDEEINIDIVGDEPAPVRRERLPEQTAMSSSLLGLKLNPDYTFDNFVVSGSNSLVHAAALKVAEAPGEYYNPLYIYGDPGLGKTHLMHSIAHFILENTPSLKIMYVTSEVFMNELVEAIRHGSVAPADFREKYRNIDVLLIDDIQFIIGKDRTQEEFFHTFNYLYEAKKQIVISSDKPPRDFNNLEERLRSRFECGLTVDLTAPDFETKMAILQKKLEIKEYESNIKLNVDDEVLSYIAQSITTNIRSLEGALTKLIALSRIKRTPINMELAEEALRDIIFPNQKKTISPEYIIDIVSEHFAVPVEEILSSKRDKYIVIPRQIAMYLTRRYTSMSTIELEKVFKRDHATILHGCDSVEKKIKTDDEIGKTVDTITKKLNI
ncbi:MAG: chromosomal replication initiator protein DnaA [Lachnospiraceae bacterium]|nr:chromosomal replication initiator protein DnaA [Lachnospiraceae bacterium]MBQ6090610.1 chromosomal replication initiator protein DnaA [Lachnospiraceae bacterium]MBR5367788.1 chromosomal replication initiator protein DnaA [Lachnospiraceae bacterium]